MPSNEDAITVDCVGKMRIWRHRDVSISVILDTLNNSGTVLKRSPKSLTRRVGGYVVKSSAGGAFAELIRHTVMRDRYRQGWRASLFLERHGIPAPAPIAHIEWGAAGLVWRHATIMTYIDDCRDVEHYYDEFAATTPPRHDLVAYMSRLAQAVNDFTDSGAFSTDLAGKNILTKDGQTFYFIDLDAVIIGATDDWYGECRIEEYPFGKSLRFKCHVQLYDSFVDRCDDELLAPFLRAMLPENVQDFDNWFSRVKSAQAKRRARTVAAWQREGKPV